MSGNGEIGGGAPRATPGPETKAGLSLLAVAPVGIYQLDLEGRLTFANERCLLIAGVELEAMLDHGYLELIHPDDRRALQREWQTALDEVREAVHGYRIVRPDGQVTWVVGRSAPRFNLEGELSGYIGSLSDVTELKRAQHELTLAEERFRRAFQDSATGMALIAATGGEIGRFLEVNEAIIRMSGYSADELGGMTYWDLVHPEELERMKAEVARLARGEVESMQSEQRMVGAGGVVRWAALSVSLIRDPDGTPLNAVVQAQDVTERKRVEGELQYLADHDPLTSLFNRRRFELELDRELAATARYGRGGAVLIVDIDDFKGVNDGRGHAAGDALLESVATALRARLRETDVVARLGGDEFGVILPHADEQRALRVAESLREVIASEARIGERHAGVTASVGVAAFGGGSDPCASDRLVARADRAMYAAKRAGRNAVRLESEGGTAEFDALGNSGSGSPPGGAEDPAGEEQGAQPGEPVEPRPG